MVENIEKLARDGTRWRVGKEAAVKNAKEKRARRERCREGDNEEKEIDKEVEELEKERGRE